MCESAKVRMWESGTDGRDKKDGHETIKKQKKQEGRKKAQRTQNDLAY